MSLMNPPAGLLIVPLAWIAAAAGRRVNRLACPPAASDAVAPVERTAFGLATGYILLALGVLALGLLRLLSPLPVALWCAVLAVAGWREHAGMARELAAGVSRLPASRAALGWPPVGLLAACPALAGCFVPPTGAEWDSLSYHLADPKLYVAAHRIYYIPWESHSNFAFNMEMLFSIGLLAHSFALAKLFNFVLALAGSAGVYRLGLRIGGAGCGLLSVLIFALLPLVFWEAGTAYVDLAATAYATLALLALTIMVRQCDARFAVLAGVLLGGMLGCKATALVTIFLYAAGILAHARASGRPLPGALKAAVVMGCVAVLVGCAWYVKSAAYTGNPFYPFAYSIFGGRNWDPAQSAPYAAAQYAFGTGHKPSDLLLVPWNLTMYLMPGHIPPAGYAQPFNDFQYAFASLSPLFLIGLIAALAVPLHPTRGLRLLAAYVMVALAIWFYMTQQVRYLLPVVPAMCVLAAWIAVRMREGDRPLRIASAVAVVASLGFSACLLLMYGSAMLPAAFAPAPEQDRYIASGLESYPAMRFINASTPADSKVVTYGEPRTLYLNRQHLWGDPGHSTVIPYTQFQTPQELRAWLLARGYRYILVNRRYAPLTAGPGWSGMVFALTLGSGGAPAYENGSTVVYAL